MECLSNSSRKRQSSMLLSRPPERDERRNGKEINTTTKKDTQCTINELTEVKMDEKKIEEIMTEVNDWPIEDLRELADRCNSLAEAVECDQQK
jgi:hypothetical protein